MTLKKWWAFKETMPLSPELQFLHDTEATYSADPSYVGNRLAGKVLLMLGGGSKTGKTTLIGPTTEILPDSTAVPSIMDRRRKPGDPVDYKTLDEGITTDDLMQRIERRELINYAIHPAGKIYATEIEGYKNTYNILPTMMNDVSVEQLKRAPFDYSYTGYIVLSGELWRNFIHHDPFNGEKDRVTRMEEGIESITYAQNHIDEIEFVRNRAGRIGRHKAAVQLSMVAYGLPGYDKNKAAEKLDEMLTVAKDLAR